MGALANNAPAGTSGDKICRSTSPDRASEQSFAADLVAVDVVGFSAFTARLVEERGAGAAEHVRDLLSAGFQAVADRLKSKGFSTVDSLGDGILLARPRLLPPGDGRELPGICNDAESAFADATSGLRIRAAHASGDLCLWRMGGWRGKWETIATGPVVDDAHVAMRFRRRDHGAGQRGQPIRAVTRAGSTKAGANGSAGARQLTAEIRHSVVTFVALRFGDGQRAHLSTLHTVVLTAQRLAQAWGGRLEKVSHDDKGILLNLCFERTRHVGATAIDSAFDCILDLQAAIEDARLEARFGIAEGLVYHGPLLLSGRPISIVHGPAVNRSAKLASSDLAMLTVDASAAAGLSDSIGPGAEVVLPDGSHARGFELRGAEHKARERITGEETLGRDAELAMLAQAAHLLRNGTGGIVTLAGAPGVGKTRVLQAFRVFVPSQAHAISVGADPKRASDYMFLWRAVLTELARTHGEWFQPAMAAHEIADDLHGIVADVVTMPELPSSKCIEGLASSARRELLERAITAIVGFVARREALLICVDDAHWLDDASCKLLSDVIRETPSLLVVLAHRDESYQHIDELTEACSPARITLGPLARSAIDAIVARTKPDLANDADACEQVFNLSGGNPFHAEQIAYWISGTSAKAIVPQRSAATMLRHVLDERLDSLSADETRVVRVLSVFDRPLLLSELQELCIGGGESVHTAAATSSLTAKGFVSASGVSDTDTFAIMRHRLLSDAVTARIPPSETAQLHARAARFLSRLRVQRSDLSISDAVIAAHWRDAGAADRAAVRFGIAGDVALAVGAHKLAIAHYSDALALNPAAIGTGRVAGWQASCAVAYWAQGDMYRAINAAENALSILDERLGGPRWLPGWVRATTAVSRRTLLCAVGLGQMVVPRAARGPLVTVSAIRAEMALYLGDLRMIIGANTTMLALARDRHLLARARARALSFLGHVAGLVRLDFLAHRGWNAARKAGTSAGDNVAASHGYLGEALWHVSFGRWHEMRQQLAYATELCGGLHDPVYFKFVETLLALGAYYEGKWEECRARFIVLHQHGMKQENRSTEAWGLYGQAEALIVPGRLDEAAELLALAEPLVNAMPDKQSQIICCGLRTQILFLRGAKGDALAEAQECLRLAQALPAFNFGSLEGFAAPAEVASRLALDEGATKDIRAAAALMVKPALKALARFAAVHPIARPRLELCRALAERLRGEETRAVTHLNEGMRWAQNLLMTFEQTKLQRELSAGFLVGTPMERLHVEQ